jgi:C2 domain
MFDLVPDASALHNQSADGASESGASKDTFCGLLTILIAGAKYLPGARDTINVMAKTSFGDKKFQTASVTDVPGIDPNNPSFDATYSIPLTPTMVKEAPDITFQVLNHDAVMGDFKVPLAHILQVPQLTLENEHILPDGGTLLTKTMLLGMVPHA